MAKVKITIHAGAEGQPIKIEVDARVAGSLANGAFADLESLYDGRGNLLDPQNQSVANDLGTAGSAFREVYRASSRLDPRDAIVRAGKAASGAAAGSTDYKPPRDVDGDNGF